MKLRPMLMVSACIALFASSISAEPSRSRLSQETAPKVAVVVRMVGDSFVPNVVEIRRGQAVLWKNTSLDTHTVTADPGAARTPGDASLPDGAHPFDSGPLGLGQTYTHSFDIPGVYRYFCMLHEGERMVGTVVVKP